MCLRGVLQTKLEQVCILREAKRTKELNALIADLTPFQKKRW